MRDGTRGERIQDMETVAKKSSNVELKFSARNGGDNSGPTENR